MARSKQKKRQKKKRSDNLQRSRPKHSTSDFIKAMSIAGLSIGFIAALFIVNVDSKPLIDHITEVFGNTKETADSATASSQMDRYTDQESEGLDKLIKEKSK